MSNCESSRSTPPSDEGCDHDWHFDGDPSTGIEWTWTCRLCLAVDNNREAPSYDDDVI